MTTISVITPTFRREDLLARCVESVLAQQVTGAQIEHIVVNDADSPLSRVSWMDDPRVRVLETRKTERAVARNTGAALSQGDWLYFLDDDDYALPGGFQALVALAAQTDAVHIYGGYRVLQAEEETESVVQPTIGGEFYARMVAGEMLPPQASWVRRAAFFATGGFDPLMVPGEDVDLFRRVALIGPLAGTQVLVAAVRVEHPETTTSETLKQQRWRQSADKCLSLPQTYGLLRQQTHGQSYWRGRCVREYIASAQRAGRAGHFGIAGSRATAGLGLSFPALLRPAFWHGLRRRPLPPTLP